jgi:hypothetical protein
MIRDREIQNAVIDSVFIGYEDYGIFTCSVSIQHAHGFQSFGGYCLDNYDENKKKSVGTAYGLQFIILLLQLFEVKSIDQLKGLPCRVDSKYDKIYRIGHFLKDTWFDPKKDLEDFKV